MDAQLEPCSLAITLAPGGKRKDVPAGTVVELVAIVPAGETVEFGDGKQFLFLETYWICVIPGSNGGLNYKPSQLMALGKKDGARSHRRELSEQ